MGWNGFRFKKNMRPYKTILKVCNPHQFFKYFFLFTEELLAKNEEEIDLYSIKINPNKPMNCTAYGTQKFLWFSIISSLIPPSNACDLWNHELGIDLMKETVSKICLRKFISAYISTTQTAQFSQP